MIVRKEKKEIELSVICKNESNNFTWYEKKMF